MSTNTIIGIIVVIVIIGGGLFFLMSDRGEVLVQCEVDIAEAQAAAEGQICTQQVLEMQCGTDDSVAYLAKNGCEIPYLEEAGWTAVDDEIEEVMEEDTPEENATDGEEEMSEEMSEEEGENENVITYTSSGFSPSTITIKKGGTVTWVNESGRNMWVASAFHPTHVVYPGSDIQKCGTAEAASIFDACGNIPVGEAYSFTFDEVGEWGYHDHLRASNFGQVIVE